MLVSIQTCGTFKTVRITSFPRLGAVLLVFLLTACDHSSDVPTKDTVSTQEKPSFDSGSPIEVIRVETKTVQDVIFASGTIAAKQTSPIGPLVEGVIEKIYVRVGDRPRKGDRLFQIRAVEYEQEVARSQGALEVAQANLDLQLKRLQRARQMVGKKFLSDAEFDLTVAEAQVAQANVQSAEANLEVARQRLKDTLVLAPFDGTVTGRFADEGIYMSNRFSMGGQSSVVELSEAEIVAGIMQVPEALLAKLRLGQRALIYPGGGGKPIESEVFIINDRVNPETRMAEFRLPVANPNYRIKPGQFVKAEVFTESHEVIVLPGESLLKQDGVTRVAVYEDGQFTLKEVDTKNLEDGTVLIVDGLEDGQLVAKSPSDALNATAKELTLVYVDS
jgi:RND family efflux transporter MFP subunit